MKKLLAIVLLGLSSLVTAQTVQTTPNLITSGTNHTWYGLTTGALPTGCGANNDGGACSGGPQPIYDPATNMISFSYNASASVGQTMAINNALAGVGAGVKINGYNYSYQARNMNGDDRQGAIDTFTVSQLLRGPANSVLLSSSQYYNTKFEWTTVSGTKTATTPYNLADTSYIQFGVSGGDNGYWGGYFGPQIRNVSMSLNYTVDPCATNPAYSPTCANYNTVTTSGNLLPGITGQQAYAINQALSFAGAGAMIHGFDYGYSYNVAGRSCAVWDIFGFCVTGFNYSDAGVSTVITDSNNATIHSNSTTHNGGDNGVSGTYAKQFRLGSSVPMSTLGAFAMSPWTSGNASITNMYSKAVYTADPCLDPLSSPSCPGYTAAYTAQMCTASPLYSTACPGYAQALFTQQCNANQLSNPSCPGYASAYLTQQCTLDPLYSTTCAGYETAYFNQQCSLDPLYNSRCTGYTTAYHDQQCSISPLYASDCAGYDAAYLTQQCNANPLYSTQCTGYAAAYQTQQCNANPLYNTQCTGYAAAYQTQQCNANALYNAQCPGYAVAYKSQQCSLSGLYATDCPNYATAYKAQQCSLNPLYATDCPGYATAYFNQQCSLSPLYNSQCPGYGVAYHDQQCRANPLFASDCNGYQEAYFTQQCTANQLYSANCPGYQVAYKTQQCSLNALYATDCPGYAQAYLNDQCLRDSLFSTQCEGYKTAYAIKYLVGLNPAVTTAVNSTLTNVVETQRNDPANVTGTVDAFSTATGGATSTPSATTSAASVSPVAVISTIKPAPAPATTTMAQAEPKKDEPKKDEGKKDGNGPNGPGPGAGNKPSDQPKSNREALAERRAEAAKKDAVAKGKELANEMGKAADMEAQKAIQNVVIQAMGFTPGFDAYNKAMIPDTTFYKPYSVYGNQKNVDNQNASRRLMGGSDRTHQEMVDSQFQLGK